MNIRITDKHITVGEWITLPMEREKLTKILDKYNHEIKIEKFDLPFMLTAQDIYLHEINDTLIRLSTLDLSSSKINILYDVIDKVAEQNNENREWREATEIIMTSAFKIVILPVTNKEGSKSDIAKYLYTNGYIKKKIDISDSAYDYIDWTLIWDVCSLEGWTKYYDVITGYTYAVRV